MIDEIIFDHLILITTKETWFAVTVINLYFEQPYLELNEYFLFWTREFFLIFLMFLLKLNMKTYKFAVWLFKFKLSIINMNV